MGDLLQLKPVHGHWIFEKPQQYLAEDHLWRLFTVTQLAVNQRQIGDKNWEIYVVVFVLVLKLQPTLKP